MSISSRSACYNIMGGILVDTESVSGFVGSGPLLVGEFLESGPKVVLSSNDVSVVTFWASVDWFTGSNGLLEVFVVPAGLEEKDDDHDVNNGKSDKNETEHLSTSESSDETSVNGGAASEAGLLEGGADEGGGGEGDEAQRGGEGQSEITLQDVGRAWMKDKPATVNCVLTDGDGQEVGPYQLIFSR